jgi:hypothetical protein
VGDEQHGLAGLHPQLFQVDAHLLAGQRIERAERLVHQDKRAHDRGAPVDQAAIHFRIVLRFAAWFSGQLTASRRSP